MKKLLSALVLFLFVFTLSSCGEKEEATVDSKLLEMKTILITGGYVVESLTYGRVFDYYRAEIEVKFELELDIYAVYHCFVNETEREVYLVAFSNSDDAKTYKEALINENIEGRYIHIESSVVLITESEETYNLFQ